MGMSVISGTRSWLVFGSSSHEDGQDGECAQGGGSAIGAWMWEGPRRPGVWSGGFGPSPGTGTLGLATH